VETVLSFVTGANAPAAARERVVDLVSDVVGDEEASLLRLLVSEVITEAVERAEGRRRVIEVHVDRHARHLRVEVTKTGPPTNGGNAGGSSPGALRGTILEEATTACGADDHDGGRVWFELDLGAA
jgi:hypothetical protein